MEHLTLSSPGHHAGFLQRGSGALHPRHPGGGAGGREGVDGEGLLRVGLPGDEAADVPHRHEDPAGLRARADQDGRAAAGGSFRGNDQEPVLSAHRRAVQRTVPGKRQTHPRPTLTLHL